MPQRVHRGILAETGDFGRLPAHPLHLPRRDMALRVGSRKQPAIDLPIGPQKIDELMRQHHVSGLYAGRSTADGQLLGRQHQRRASMSRVVHERRERPINVTLSWPFEHRMSPALDKTARSNLATEAF